MSPVGWGREHLSSGPLCLAVGVAKPATPACGLAAAVGRRRPTLTLPQLASLAGLPLLAKHMASLFSFFTGNRDS